MAITKKHSELSGSSLHKPLGITLPDEQLDTLEAVIELDVENKQVLPVGTAVDFGSRTLNREFKDIYISGKIYQDGYEFSGGGGSGGIFITETSHHWGGSGLTDNGLQRFEATGSLNVTGSLSVEGPISGALYATNLSIDDSLWVPGTVTASAFFSNGLSQYLVPADVSQSVFITSSVNNNVFREFGYV